MSNIQTSSFVKKLAANDRPTRTAALESLKKFLQRPKELPLLELEKLWKGLFYAMWFSDRPRPQQRLTVELGSLYEIIPLKNFKNFMLAFWVIIAKEWSSIDHHRLDKFLLLVRRVVFFQLKRLAAENYEENLVDEFLSTLRNIPLSGDPKVPNGIPFHLIDIYVDEIERVMFSDLDEPEDDASEEDIDKYAEEKVEIIENTPLDELLSPFKTLSVEAKFKPLRQKIKQDLFTDSRLRQWGAVDDPKKSNGKDEVEDESDEDNEEEQGEESDEDEWKGFA